MIAVALPEIGRSFQVATADLTIWLVTSYLLVNVILLSPAGKLGDLVGRRRAFNIGLSLFTTGILLATFAPVLPMLSASRVLMAAGGAMLMPNAMALLRTVIPEQGRARAFGYFAAALGASAAAGPLIGGVLTRYLGWESIFLINLPIVFVAWILVKREHTYAPKNPTSNDDYNRFDFAGMMLLGASISVLVIGLKLGGTLALASILISGLGIYLFTLLERRVADPLIDLDLFRRLPFTIGGTIVGLHNLGMYALLFQLPFFLKHWYGLDPSEIGQVLLMMMLCMVIFSSIGGRLSERIGPKATIIMGLFVSITGMLLLVFSDELPSILRMGMSLAWIGSGIGMVTGPSQAISLAVVPASQSGAASGVLSTMRYVGGIGGVTVISTVLTATDPTHLLEQNRFCFTIYLCVYSIALFIALFLPRHPGNLTRTRS